MTDLKATIKQFADLLNDATTVLILQPDSPDADSFGSALGLEEILGDLGKTVHLYSYREPEPYLRRLEGADRVVQDFPRQFDLTIIVDTGSPALIKSALDHYAAAIMSRPVVVLDHHTSRQPFGFTTIDVVDHSVATAELIMWMALELDWPVNERGAHKLATALLADSLGLTTSGTTARSVAMYAELAARGASPHELHREHRASTALDADQVHLKGALLSSIEYLCDGELAIAHITPDIVAANTDKFEPYNMIIGDMQWTRGVKLAAVFKDYGTKINVPMRSTDGSAGPLAEILGGGGHPNAGAWRCPSTDYAAERERLIATYQTYRQEHA